MTVLDTSMMRFALPCIAALGLLLFLGGLHVSAMRARFSTLYGCTDDPTHALTKAVRAHGNTAEYAALLAVLMLALALRPMPGWVAWTMVGVTVSRYLLAVGILLSPTLARPHPVRAIGALGTYVGGTALCAALLLPA